MSPYTQVLTLMKHEGLFPNFNGWKHGYGAFPYATKEQARRIEYIKNQEEQHKQVSFRDAYMAL